MTIYEAFDILIEEAREGKRPKPTFRNVLLLLGCDAVFFSLKAFGFFLAFWFVFLVAINTLTEALPQICLLLK